VARYARVATISCGGAGRRDTPAETIAANRQAQVRLAEQAALDRPDVICMTETITWYGLGPEALELAAEPLDGPTLQEFSGLARAAGTYIVVPILTRERSSIYNSAILLDRRGSVAAVYHKMFLTFAEMEWGIRPGTQAVVTATDFGRVGFAICFDLNFREVGAANQAAGAELLLFPSMYPGGLLLSTWAHDFKYFVVSATPRDGSRFVDPLGRVFARSETAYQPVLVRRLNLDYRVVSITYSHPKLPDVKRRYGPDVDVDIARDEAAMCLYSLLDDKSAADVLAEFGMETRAEYFERLHRARAAALRQCAAARS
jgi:hypothetical protein